MPSPYGPGPHRQQTTPEFARRRRARRPDRLVNGGRAAQRLGVASHRDPTGGVLTAHAATGTSKAAPPAATLGIYTAQEDSSNGYSTVSGQHPDIANDYLAWGQPWPSQFISQAEAAGATPFIEIEPWHAGPSWNQTPSFSSIMSNGDASDTNCSLDGQTYSTPCNTWLADIGLHIQQLGKPVILTFAHEPNVSGQYPWSQDDTGSCGSSSCTPAQWIAAWDEVQSVVASGGGASDTYWMWAPNVDTGGTTTDPSPWWPGAAHVDMVGVDGTWTPRTARSSARSRATSATRSARYTS
jgi:beta-mannanase